MGEVIIATRNKGKAEEFKKMFQKKGIIVKTLLDFPYIEEVEETGTTFEENAILKAEGLSKKLNRLVIADDSGLEVDALNGAPGIYSARYAGVEKDDEANIQKVLKELEGVEESKRTARFVCVLAVARPNGTTLVFRGVCEGFISTEKRGQYGFGYDPIFYLKELRKTMAELTPDEKEKISHRGKALRQLEMNIESLF